MKILWECEVKFAPLWGWSEISEQMILFAIVFSSQPQSSKANLTQPI